MLFSGSIFCTGESMFSNDILGVIEEGSSLVYSVPPLFILMTGAKLIPDGITFEGCIFIGNMGAFCVLICGFIMSG
jgi:vacuolar-type H+-ATPase subunit I/STV1